MCVLTAQKSLSGQFTWSPLSLFLPSFPNPNLGNMPRGAEDEVRAPTSDTDKRRGLALGQAEGRGATYSHDDV